MTDENQNASEAVEDVKDEKNEIPAAIHPIPNSFQGRAKVADLLSQNSQEDDEEEEEEEEDDDEDEQVLHIEGMLEMHELSRCTSPLPHSYAWHNRIKHIKSRSNSVRSEVSVKSDDSQAFKVTCRSNSQLLESCKETDSSSCGSSVSPDPWPVAWELSEDELCEIRDKLYKTLKNSAYDPSDYEHLTVSSEIKDLFQYITRYTPQTIELDHKLKPFIPDFIPAVGDIDAFIKVPPPTGEPDKLGLAVLDEPSAKQSEPTVLDLQLRAVSKETTSKSVVVKSLENADKNPKEIEAWITSIGNLHRSKPPPTVHYARNMPEIDALMQEWPPEFEELLKTAGLPSADLDCTLEEYVNIISGLLDIPVYKSKVQSLHVLFTLYSEFKNSQHFKALAMENKLDNALKQSSSDQPDRLVL